MKFIKFLNYPYPFYENTKQAFRISLSIGLFIGAFCYLFKPFGLDKIDGISRLGYGLVSFIVCSFFMIVLPLIFNKQLKNKGWKIYKEIIWILIINLSLATANYFYTGFVFYGGYKFYWSIFLLVLLYTLVIALIPAIAIIMYKQLFVYKKIIKDTQKIDSELALKKLVRQKINANDNFIVFNSETKNDTLKINAQDFYFLVASGNYIEVYYNENNMLEKKLIRNNISKIEHQLKKTNHFMRCHRSHIVNLNCITHITGNLQGYQLHFDLTNQIIPVSRSFSKEIKDRILKN